MIGMIVNPGTEPVENTSEEQAEANIQQFIKDCDIGDDDRWRIHYLRTKAPEEGGRYGFIIYNHCNVRAHLVDMPGCDLDLVRQAKPWVSPRLYVDGSSWLWNFALKQMALGKGYGDD